MDKSKDWKRKLGGGLLFKLVGFTGFLVGGGIISVVAWGSLQEDKSITFELVMLAVVFAITMFLSFYNYTITISNPRRRVQKAHRFGWIPFRVQSADYKDFDKLELRTSTMEYGGATVARSEQRATAQETRFQVYLTGKKDILVDDFLTPEPAQELLSELSEYTGLPQVSAK